jgi:hypothetical protein
MFSVVDVPNKILSPDQRDALEGFLGVPLGQANERNEGASPSGYCSCFVKVIIPNITVAKSPL